MGCLCSKGASSDEPAEVHIKKESNKSSTPLSPPSKREGVVVQTTGVGNGAPGRTVSCISKVPQQVDLNSTPPVPQQVEPKSTPPVPQQVESKATPPVPQQVNSNSVRVSQKVNSDGGGNTSVLVQPIPKAHHKRRSSTVEIGSGRAQLPMARIISMPSGAAGEQAAAGWPSWLTAVAGEAIKGWLPRRADSFEKFAKIGQGTYSTVYKARDLDTGKVVAMKKVRFVNMDPESVRFMAREIYLLRKLDHPNVMKLEGLVTSRISCSLYLVFEYMEHDLAGLAATPGIKFTAPQIKCYMQQLLSGLEHCHNRGVLHRDIKGSNLLIDDNGNLKIADFGLATLFNPDNKQPMTSRVVTLWYRPPELLLGATDYGVAVDLWSTGCILAELLAGKPIMPGRTEVEQLHKIFKLCGSPSEEYWRKSKLPHATIFKPQHPYKRCVSETFKDISPSAFALLDVLLAIEPEGRGSATSALNSEFFTAEPLPCDPSSLPKYPPSKEFDAKLRDEEARKKRAAAKGHVNGSKRRGSADSKAVPAPDANAELQASKQGGGKQNGSSYSSQVNHTNAYESSRKDADFGVQKSSRNHQAAELSKFSGSVAARNSSRYDSERDRSSNAHWPEQRLNSRYNQLEETEPSEKSEWNHHLLDRPTSSQRKGERMRDKEFTTGYVPKKNRIHYSGPLLPPGGNVEEMLKEHERQIQQAVRKARLHKAKTKKNIG